MRQFRILFQLDITLVTLLIVKMIETKQYFIAIERGTSAKIKIKWQDAGLSDFYRLYMLTKCSCHPVYAFLEIVKYLNAGWQRPDGPIPLTKPDIFSEQWLNHNFF